MQQPDYQKPGDVVLLGEHANRPFVRQPDSVRYRYKESATRCPVCKGLGIPWSGWFSCDGAGWCQAVALVDTGEVFRPQEAQECPTP